MDSIIVTMLESDKWHLSFLPINKSGAKVRRASDQLEAAWVGSMGQTP